MGILLEKNITLVVDFDSTVVKTETLEKLADHVLQDDPNKAHILARINDITKKGMEGFLPFSESLSQRLKLFHAHRDDVEHIALQTIGEITDSFSSHRSFISENADRIHIISGGFKEVILSTTRLLGIDDSHVHANRFIYDEDSYVIGADASQHLAQEHGKIRQVQALDLPGEVWVVGDGYTDYAIKKEGAAVKFFAFVEHVFREPVVAHADGVLSSFDDLHVHIHTA